MQIPLPVWSLSALVLCVLTASCRPGTDTGAPTGVTAKLEQLIPTMQAYQLVAFRNESWCRAIEYRRGRFASGSEPACISILSGSRRPFDQQSRRDLAAIQQQCRATLQELRTIQGSRFGENGELQYAVFDLRDGSEGSVLVFSTTELAADATFENIPLRPIGGRWYRGG